VRGYPVESRHSDLGDRRSGTGGCRADPAGRRPR
jgi:hypothetical protein